MDTVALATAVPQDVPPLHVREGVLDACSDPPVNGVELDLPGEQPTTVTRTPIGHDDLPVSLVAAVGHHARAAAGVVGTRVAERGAVVVVARHRAADRYHQTGWRR